MFVVEWAGIVLVWVKGLMMMCMRLGKRKSSGLGESNLESFFGM